MPSTAEGVPVGAATWESHWAVCTSYGLTLPILGAHPTKSVHTGTPRDTYGAILRPQMETTQMPNSYFFILKNWGIFV